MQPLANLGGTEETRPRSRNQNMMPFRYHRMEGKEQLLELLDPEHEVELDGTFLKHLAAAIRASSPSERQQALDKAAQAYENALDDVLYENGGILGRKAEHDARRSQNFSGQLGSPRSA
jgi:hypothetical protein